MTTTTRPPVTGEAEAVRLLNQGINVQAVAELTDVPLERVEQLRGHGTPLPAAARPVPASPVRAVPAPAPARPAPSSVNVTIPDPTAALLRQASIAGKKGERLAARIGKDLEQLRTLVADAERTAAAKAAEQQAKAKAREDVERLEKQLAEARARLAGSKPKKKPAAKKPAAAVRVVDGVATGPELCTDCGGFITRPAGTHGRWPLKCSTCKAQS